MPCPSCASLQLLNLLLESPLQLSVATQSRSQIISFLQPTASCPLLQLSHHHPQRSSPSSPSLGPCRVCKHAMSHPASQLGLGALGQAGGAPRMQQSLEHCPLPNGVCACVLLLVRARLSGIATGDCGGTRCSTD